jgi:hypothetical protein
METAIIFKLARQAKEFASQLFFFDKMVMFLEIFV